MNGQEYSPEFMEALNKLRATTGMPPLNLNPTPAPVHTPAAAPWSEEKLRQVMQEELNRHIPARLQDVIGKFEGVFQKALPVADYQAFQAYVNSGSPGFDKLLASDKLYPIIQLLWETIKEESK